MDQQVFKYFTAKQDFICTAAKTHSILYDYHYKKIIHFQGYRESFSFSSKLNDNEYFNNLISGIVYIKISMLIKRFYIVKNRRDLKKFLFTFIAGPELLGNKGVWLIHFQIDSLSKNAKISACEISSAGALNDKLFLVSEYYTGNLIKVIFAANIFSNRSCFLHNHEFDVLQFLSMGLSSEEVADLLCLSKHTVDDYRKTLLEKFNAINIYQLIRHAQQESFI